eukprot:TRINITY_DN43_c1_g1_i4.p1 TRINITY_DN43_c1_g1~~TRINITY_DN43_c1_g1_i4.p1  ORF type:complete len:848 (+),score=390.99 TRINITY_DN43_c1_g1_i4:121-2544(+)
MDIVYVCLKDEGCSDAQPEDMIVECDLHCNDDNNEWMYYHSECMASECGVEGIRKSFAKCIAGEGECLSDMPESREESCVEECRNEVIDGYARLHFDCQIDESTACNADGEFIGTKRVEYYCIDALGCDDTKKPESSFEECSRDCDKIDEDENAASSKIEGDWLLSTTACEFEAGIVCGVGSKTTTYTCNIGESCVDTTPEPTTEPCFVNCSEEYVPGYLDCSVKYTEEGCGIGGEHKIVFFCDLADGCTEAQPDVIEGIDCEVPCMDTDNWMVYRSSCIFDSEDMMCGDGHYDIHYECINSNGCDGIAIPEMEDHDDNHCYQECNNDNDNNGWERFHSECLAECNEDGMSEVKYICMAEDGICSEDSKPTDDGEQHQCHRDCDNHNEDGHWEPKWSQCIPHDTQTLCGSGDIILEEYYCNGNSCDESIKPDDEGKHEQCSIPCIPEETEWTQFYGQCYPISEADNGCDDSVKGEMDIVYVCLKDEGCSDAQPEDMIVECDLHCNDDNNEWMYYHSECMASECGVEGIRKSFAKCIAGEGECLSDMPESREESCVEECRNEVIDGYARLHFDCQIDESTACNADGEFIGTKRVEYYCIDALGCDDTKKPESSFEECSRDCDKIDEDENAASSKIEGDWLLSTTACEFEAGIVCGVGSKTTTYTCNIGESCVDTTPEPTTEPCFVNCSEEYVPGYLDCSVKYTEEGCGIGGEHKIVFFCDLADGCTEAQPDVIEGDGLAPVLEWVCVGDNCTDEPTDTHMPCSLDCPEWISLLGECVAVNTELECSDGKNSIEWKCIHPSARILDCFL